MADATRPQPLPLIPLPSRERIGSPLPTPLTSFVGREREVAAVVDLLRQEEVRLVTLTGPGGVGKTRLAFQIARLLEPEFADGVVYLPLAAIGDPALVHVAIAHTLGIRDAGDRPLEERVALALLGREVLLVLDNFEHVLDASPLIVKILAACPSVQALVTSRTVLRLSGEHDFPVPVLDHPGPDAALSVERLAGYPAIRLFVDRARAADSDFNLSPASVPAVAAIVRRLDGLPLAIELAAARTKSLPPPALLPRLATRLPLLTGGPRDAPYRLRTMRAAIAWSHDLLAPTEQALYRRLAVFAGGFTLDAAEYVGRETGDGRHELPQRDRSIRDTRLPFPDFSVSVLESLTALVDQSLVQRDNPT